MDWLSEHHPDLVERYLDLYRRGAYAPVRERRRLAGLLSGPDLGPSERGRGSFLAPAAPAPPADEPSQERLF
jgi:hypothetical protein